MSRSDNSRRGSAVLTMTARPDALDGGWVAECPELPCWAQGETRGGALASLRDAAAAVISLRMERQDPALG
jgi:predicted RNase H-like HicB family nuclease